MSDEKQMLDRILADKKANRRDFMAGATAIGMTAAAANTMWTNRAHAAEPKKGGHMKAGLNDSNTVDSLDPATFNATTMIAISRAFRDSLVEVGQDDSAQPALAESWEASDDATEWRFKLRPGVEFSNGKSLTTEDVINSINVHRGEESKSGAKGVFAAIDDVSADGKNTVVVKLSGGNADFPFLMTDYHMNILPTKDGKADVMSDVGTGTYLLKEFEPGIRASFEKNPNGWQSDEFGYVDSAELVTLLDDTARVNALISGDVDIINRPELKTIGRLKRVKSVNIIDVPSNLAFTHPMRTEGSPFDNVDFRLALKYAVDRQAFVDKVLYGYGVVGNDQPLGPKMASYDPSLTVEQDLDRAKYHLEKSGLADAAIKYQFADTAYNGAADAAQLFQQDWEKAGINVSLQKEPKDGYWSNVWNKEPFCACYWGPRPIEDMILSIAYVGGAEWNDTNIDIASVNTLVTAARAELDVDKRKDMYQTVQHLLSSRGGTLVPAFGKDIAATNKKIGIGPNIGGGWEMDGGHFIKRWWINA